jgi:lysophospholipase L1-like esterase
VVLLAGINDLRAGATAADCAGRLGQCLALLREAGVPTTVIAIPPHSQPAMQAAVEATNHLIAEACQHHAADLLDPTLLLLRDGLLDPALTFDGLHLNAEGYLRLAGALRVHLQAKVAE